MTYMREAVLVFPGQAHYDGIEKSSYDRDGQGKKKRIKPNKNNISHGT